MARMMQLMNSLGHISVHWEEQNDEKVLPLIQEMLDSGFTFFILQGDQQVNISNVTEITDRKINIHDDLLQQMYDAGLLQVGGVVDDTAETTGEVARTPEDVAAHDTVVTPPKRGG